MKTEIKPCWNPECKNGLTQLECAPKGDSAIWNVYCYGCGACSPYFETQEEAIALHNRIKVIPEWVTMDLLRALRVAEIDVINQMHMIKAIEFIEGKKINEDITGFIKDETD